LKYRYLFILLQFFGKSVFGQTIFDLKSSQLRINTADFHVVEIVDLRASKSDYIGEIYVSDRKTEKVKIHNGIERGILDYYAKIIPKKRQQTEIKIEIKNILIEENRLSNGQIAGKIKYDITAYTQGANGTKPLCNTRNSGQYVRNLGNTNIPNIQLQLQQSIDNGLNFIDQYIKKNKSKLEVYASSSQVIIKPFETRINKDTVFYQQRKVTWNDFLGQVRNQTHYGAAIYSSFGINSKMFVEEGSIKIEVTPMVFTDKKMSWAKPEIKNDFSLKHEQLHFDICYLMSLKFLKTIKSFKAKSLDDLSSMIQYEYLEFYKKTHNLQEEYDSETNHSIIKDKQLEWESKITAEIKQFDVNDLFKN
jgi:hypothetical protein